MAAPCGYTLVGAQPKVSVPLSATAPSKALALSSSSPSSPVGAALTAPAAPTAVKEAKEDDKKTKAIDKQTLSIDLLMVGYVQSYIDFFYISHRKPQLSPDDDIDGQTSEQTANIPEETMTFLKETLESAETARRQKNFHHCFEHYNLLSDYFEKIDDLKGAKYFYERCAQVATEVDAQESIAKAKLSLGTCEEKAKNWKEAKLYHEEALEIATNADSLPLQMKISVRLTHVYRVLAEECEREGKDQEANAYFLDSKASAEKTKDPTLEGISCHLLGKSYYKLGKYTVAIELQQQYLDICRSMDDRVSEAQARGALARCYEATGDTPGAIKQLESLLSVASDAGEFHAQAGACLNLGLLYHAGGEYEKSVELLEQHFDLARQLGDRKLIDSARVILGMARGNGKFDLYTTLVNTNMEKLLKWKSKRLPLES